MRYLRDDYLGYLLGFVLFVSCSHEQDKKQRTSSINLRQQYVKTNKFLDVDMSKFLPGTQTQASVTAEDSAQMFVALYRFYSHVKVVDDAYVCDLTNAQEIQVSERVFRSLSENLQKTNLQIQRLKEQGKKVIISEITPEDTVLLIGGGPTGICTLLCTRLKKPRRIILCEKSEERIRFIREHYPEVLVTTPEQCVEFVQRNSDHGGADVVIEVAGAPDTFQLAWQCARPNALVTVVALYDQPQVLPLPDMYGKNLTFKTGGVDGCDCAEILQLIAEGKIDTTPLITHRFPLQDIEKAYHLFEHHLDGVIKVAITV